MINYESRSGEVRFDGGGVPLVGTFVDPGKARAATLILTGSGKLDRNSNGRLRLQVNPAIAEALADQCVASLRYDKRGAGESGGDFFATGMSENYADAVAAVDCLATRTAGRPIYAVGHSEGALHAARLVAEGRVAGAVVIGCPARRGEEILSWQAAQIVPTLPPATKAVLRLLHIDPLASQQKALARIRLSSADSLRIQGKKQNARWQREFMDYDPTPVFKRIDRPILVVVPEHDMHVPPEDGAAIRNLVPGPCEEVIVPALSHILRDDPESRGPVAYRRAVKKPVSPILLEAITDWVTRQLTGHPTDNPDERDRR